MSKFWQGVPHDDLRQADPHHTHTPFFDLMVPEFIYVLDFAQVNQLYKNY